MKLQIKHLSVHQNGKVIGIVISLFSLPFFLFSLLAFLASNANQNAEPSSSAFGAGFFIVGPIIYFVITYIVVAVICYLYNFIQKYVGGIEYEADSKQDPL